MRTRDGNGQEYIMESTDSYPMKYRVRASTGKCRSDAVMVSQVQRAVSSALETGRLGTRSLKILVLTGYVWLFLELSMD